MPRKDRGMRQLQKDTSRACAAAKETTQEDKELTTSKRPLAKKKRELQIQQIVEREFKQLKRERERRTPTNNPS